MKYARRALTHGENVFAVQIGAVRMVYRQNNAYINEWTLISSEAFQSASIFYSESTDWKKIWYSFVLIPFLLTPKKEICLKEELKPNKAKTPNNVETILFFPP